MKAINEQQLQNCLDSGSTKRLKSFRKRLSSDKKKVVFDDRVYQLLLDYAWTPSKILDIADYLSTLSETQIIDGREVDVPFCRSIKQYDLMEKTWLEFMKREAPSFRWNRHYQSGLRKVQQRYATAKLNALEYRSDEDIANALTDLSTSTGWTGVVTGKAKKRDVISGAFSTLQEKILKAKEVGSFNCPVLPGVRTQCSGEFTDEGEKTHTCKHKTRPIWMTDVYVIMAERMMAKPLTEWLKSYPYSAVGKSDEEISRIIHSHQLKGWTYTSLDYSKYDSSIPSWLIRSAFDIIRSSFKSYDDSLLTVLETDFIEKNLITADSVWHITHGDPSGSGFTTIVNGICNEIMTEVWADYLGVEAKYIIMGDDNLIYTSKQVDKEIIASYLSHNFGVKVNADKSTSGGRYESPEFLSRVWTPSGPYRNPNILISMMLYPEKFRPYDNSSLSPGMVVYSYVLGYLAGMRELIDVSRFLKDFDWELKSIEWTKALVKELPYNVQMAYEQNNYSFDRIMPVGIVA